MNKELINIEIDDISNEPHRDLNQAILEVIKIYMLIKNCG
jgi:hypothetical protein